MSFLADLCDNLTEGGEKNKGKWKGHKWNIDTCSGPFPTAVIKTRLISRVPSNAAQMFRCLGPKGLVVYNIDNAFPTARKPASKVMFINFINVYKAYV